MRRLKFTATARFVRVVLPPFQNPGGEQPVYKVELYGCPDDGKTNGKAKKGKYKNDCLGKYVRQNLSVTREHGLICFSCIPLCLRVRS